MPFILLEIATRLLYEILELDDWKQYLIMGIIGLLLIGLAVLCVISTLINP